LNYYLDTSVIVSVLTEESHTLRAERWLAGHGASPKLVSWSMSNGTLRFP